MKKLIAALAFIAALISIPDNARAQCNGQFGANQVCGSVAGGFAGPVNFSSFPLPAASVNWINVKQAPCNAVGNGVADDTAAINTCIGNFNTATNGILYFPAGTYKTTSCLTAITANGIIRGDGQNNQAVSAPATTIQSSTTNCAAFTINSLRLMVQDLSIYNNAGSTPISPSAGILVTSSSANQRVDYQNIEVVGFFIDVDIKEGLGWTMTGVSFTNPVQYALRINNVLSPDTGDWAISNALFSSGVNTPAALVRIEGSGGGKINNFKLNSAANAVVDGIDVIANSTVDLAITNGSIENYSGTGININGSWPQITIMGVEFGCFATSCVHFISAANTSGLVVSGITTQTGTSGTPISLTSCTNCYVTAANGIATPFSGGSKPDHDGTGGIGTFYFADGTVGTESRLEWHVPAGQFGELRILMDPGTTGTAAAIHMVNNTGNFSRFIMNGTGTSGNGEWDSSTGINIYSDVSVASGGTDDLTIQTGGTNASQESFRAAANGHIKMGGTATLPTLTAGCNGAGSVVSGSDTDGTITGQTAAATTCTLTFGTAYAAAPNCVASGLTSPLTGAITPSTTTLVVNFASTANFKWSYICLGK